MRWLQRAAAGGVAVAQLRLGMAYEHGRGVDRDLVTACAWFEVAAAGGSDAARARRDALRRTLAPEQADAAAARAGAWLDAWQMRGGR